MILWRSIKFIGKCHDSTAWKDTNLYNDLVQMADFLAERNLFFVGDSAYGIRSLLLVPYDNAKPYSKKDNFNYFLSSCRIYVECAFGEINLRFGILWRKLAFDLHFSTRVIDACLRLHNFLVKYRQTYSPNKL